MALIKCPECGREVSDQAATCPDCAYPIRGSTQVAAQGGVPADAAPPEPRTTPAIVPGQILCPHCQNPVDANAVYCFKCRQNPQVQNVHRPTAHPIDSIIPPQPLGRGRLIGLLCWIFGVVFLFSIFGIFSSPASSIFFFIAGIGTLMAGTRLRSYRHYVRVPNSSQGTLLVALVAAGAAFAGFTFAPRIPASTNASTGSPSGSTPVAQVAAAPATSRPPTNVPVTQTPRPPTPPPPTSTPLPSVGDMAQTSGWAIRLDKVETAKEIGSQFSKNLPQGVYVIVTFTAGNRQNKTSPLNAWDLKMKTDSGVSFSNSSDDIYLVGDPRPVILTDNIQPGLQKQFRNAFDVNPAINDYNLEIAGTTFRVHIL